jgi:hypothetical protein
MLPPGGRNCLLIYPNCFIFTDTILVNYGPFDSTTTTTTAKTTTTTTIFIFGEKTLNKAAKYH